MFLNATYPAQNVREAIAAGAHLVSIDGPPVNELRREYPFFRLARIPAAHLCESARVRVHDWDRCADGVSRRSGRADGVRTDQAVLRHPGGASGGRLVAAYECGFRSRHADPAPSGGGAILSRARALSMNVRSGQRAREAAVAWFLGAAALATILVLIGFGPIRGWRSSATLLAEGRAAERAELLTLAFARDMRGVQDTILMQATPGETVTWDSDFTDLVAGAFARYPYAETFFVSGGNGGSGCDPIFCQDRPSAVVDSGWTSVIPVSGRRRDERCGRAANRRAHSTGRLRRAAVLGLRRRHRRHAVPGRRTDYLSGRVSVAAQRGVRIHGRSHLGPLALLSGCRGPGLADGRDPQQFRRQHCRRQRPR